MRAVHEIVRGLCAGVERVEAALAGGIGPDVRREILMSDTDAGIDDSDDDIAGGVERIPGLGRVDVGVRRATILAGVVQMPLGAVEVAWVVGFNRWKIPTIQFRRDHIPAGSVARQHRVHISAGRQFDHLHVPKLAEVMADPRAFRAVTLDKGRIASCLGDDQNPAVAKGLAVRTHAPRQRLGVKTHRHRGDKKKRRGAAQQSVPRIFAWHLLRRNLPQARSLR